MNNRSLKFEFPNRQGNLLSGRLELPNSKPKSFAIFAHCFTCSKGILAATQISRALTKQGIGVLRFDFTGLGNSEGDFSNTNFSSNVDDLISAYAGLKDEYGAPELLIGHSLGGAAVLKAAQALVDVKAVVTIGAPSDVKHILSLFKNQIDQIDENGEAEVELAGRNFKIKKQFIEDLNESEILKGISNFKKALLVMHSPIDSVVSIDHAAKIFLAAKHPKSFVSLDTADHLLMESADAQYVANVIGAWVGRYVSNEAAAKNEITDGTLRVATLENHKFAQNIETSTHSLVADEPASVGGEDLGLGPYEFLLAGLGACTSMTIKMYADRKKWPLEAVQVDLKHDKIHATDCADCDTKDGKIDRISKFITLKGPLDDEQRRRLLEIAEKCPVNRTLKSEIEILSTNEVGTN